MLAVDVGDLVRTILFLLFADLTALVAAVVGPTYDHLLVPELASSALYPAVYGSGPTDFLGKAAAFSAYLLGNVVDPLVALLALGVALLYLARATVARWAVEFDGLLTRLVIAVFAANFTVPIAAGILSVAGGLYPVVAGWDGGAWTHWVDLAGWGELRFSWDNGALAFVLAVAEFALVFGLLLAVGIRDAVLATLLVVLPLLTLLWPFRPLSSIPRRAWLLFAELAFLPCVLVVPLELAVGSPNPILLVGYLTAALGAPFLLSTAGGHLVALGFPGAGGLAQSGVQRGFASAPSAGVGLVAPSASAAAASGPAARAALGSVRSVAGATAPLAIPTAVHELLGHGARHLARHLGHGPGLRDRPPRLPPFHSAERGEDGRR